MDKLQIYNGNWRDKMRFIEKSGINEIVWNECNSKYVGDVKNVFSKNNIHQRLRAISKFTSMLKSRSVLHLKYLLFYLLYDNCPQELVRRRWYYCCCWERGCYSELTKFNSGYRQNIKRIKNARVTTEKAIANYQAYFCLVEPPISAVRNWC